MSGLRTCLWISILAIGGTAAFAQHEPTTSEIEMGRQQYFKNCYRCPRADGDYVTNADIGRGKFKRASTDEQLVQLIRNGIPDTAMAPMDNISEANAKLIAGYLRSMAATAAAVASWPPGSANRGKTLFETKGGCINCHRVSDTGSRAGPDLSQIGGQRRSVELHRSLIEPDSEIVPANRFVKVVTRDGATTTGRLLNQDSFTIQLLDAKDEKLKSFTKTNVREFTFVDKSPMPSFKDKLSAQELADVISYLGSLKGQAQ